jgi:hypothetical protein
MGQVKRWIGLLELGINGSADNTSPFDYTA